MAGWLVFVDTNIFLDFYRLGGESAQRQLGALQRHQSSLIRTEQVRMEFLKNRQKVFLDSIAQISKPKKTSVPPILTDSQPAKMLSRNYEDAEKHFKKVTGKIDRILANPSSNDHVYKYLKKLFSQTDVLNLTKGHLELGKIHAMARRRFSLGCPPRKNSDTSFGDAINWEWIIRSAQLASNNSNVVIVSRDNDYGITRGTQTILNDWLLDEFKERVSRKRKIILTNKLTFALKKLDERVPMEDVKQEEELLKDDLPRWQFKLNDDTLKIFENLKMNEDIMKYIRTTSEAIQTSKKGD